MNKFEALHALGLGDDASQDDIRLAYYGLSKAASSEPIEDCEDLEHQIDGLLNHAREARDYLLNEGGAVSTVRKAIGIPSKKPKMKVAPTDEKKARLNGLERVYVSVVGFLDYNRNRRNVCLGIIIGIIVLSFVVIRRIYGVARIIAVSVLALVAIFASTILMTSFKYIKTSKVHVLNLEESIDDVRAELGMMPRKEELAQQAAETAEKFKAQKKQSAAGAALAGFGASLARVGSGKKAADELEDVCELEDEEEIDDEESGEDPAREELDDGFDYDADDDEDDDAEEDK